MINNPEFIVYCGPMFSSKTSRLLSTLEKYKYQHKKIVVFKPNIDDRYSMSDVVTHSGWKVPAICVKTGAEILEYLTNLDEEPHVVAVDEAFMIPGAAEALTWLFTYGFTIVVSSLEMSSAGKSFQEVEKMLTWATHVEKCTAVCTACGRDAHYTHKKHASDEEIQVGGSELYEPRCAQHFPELFQYIVKAPK
jgi:thymidine kinase